MPELPEVENTVRGLNKLLPGSKIINVWTDAPKLVRKGSFAEFEKWVKGKKIIGLKRRAKNIIISLDGGGAILIHLKMTGHLMVGNWDIVKKEGIERVVPLTKGTLADKVNGYIHLLFTMKDGRQLALSDLRKFAKIAFGKEENVLKNEGIFNIGPEATEMKFKEFASIAAGSSKNIKALLMDQSKIAGIGNIYSDDILFKAGIHPLRISRSLSEKELKAIYSAIKEILFLAIRLGGTSVSDYRDVRGEKGKYGDRRLVYGRDKEPCLKCGTLIKTIKIGGRSARFCPKCQKR